MPSAVVRTENSSFYPIFVRSGNPGFLVSRSPEECHVGRLRLFSQDSSTPLDEHSDITAREASDLIENCPVAARAEIGGLAGGICDVDMSCLPEKTKILKIDGLPSSRCRLSFPPSSPPESLEKAEFSHLKIDTSEGFASQASQIEELHFTDVEGLGSRIWSPKLRHMVAVDCPTDSGRLPAGVEASKAMAILVWKNSDLLSLPSSLYGTCQQLMLVNFQGNHLTTEGVPVVLRGMGIFKANNIRRLPDWVGEVDWEVLNISLRGNPCMEQPEHDRPKGPYERDLNFDDNHITAVPPWIAAKHRLDFAVKESPVRTASFGERSPVIQI